MAGTLKPYKGPSRLGAGARRAGRKVANEFHNVASKKPDRMTQTPAQRFFHSEKVGSKGDGLPYSLKPQRGMSAAGGVYGGLLGASIVGSATYGMAADKNRKKSAVLNRQVNSYKKSQVAKGYVRPHLITDMGTAWEKTMVAGAKQRRKKFPKFSPTAAGVGAVTTGAGVTALYRDDYNRSKKGLAAAQSQHQKTFAKSGSISAFGIDHL